VTPRSILIIDDNEPLRIFLRRVLEEAGYLVSEASNGQDGLRQFRKSPTALVITDLFMPGKDGLEVTMALRHESPTVKIIALTGASGEPDFLDIATRLGAHRTMKKPVTIVELLQAVEQELLGGPPHLGHGLHEEL
jgi:two-component system response regulator (stage 0 sporulation protein F)